MALKEKISEANNVEKDFIEFVDFALEYVNNLKIEWWRLDYEDRLRCEQLLFPQYLRIKKTEKLAPLKSVQFTDTRYQKRHPKVP